jgi:endonuclease/exonuclease/phosphatase family metal-dependent hydrolase
MLSSLFNFIGVFSAVTPRQAQSLDIRLITYNIRYDAANPQPPEAPWSTRGPLLTSQLQNETANQPNSLLCFQEALNNQVEDVHSGLGDDWEFYGLGRDGGTKGEYSPIFYRSSVWELVKGSTYWLSSTPHRAGSKGWDADAPRIVTVAQFKHTETKVPFTYMCTHFDHRGQVAREKSADFIVKKARCVAKRTGGKVFLGGDLNITPENQAYKTLASKLGDVKDKVPTSKHYGNEGTFTGFRESSWSGRELDHIFVQNDTGIEWDSFGILNNTGPDGTRISDHRPVAVDFTILA